MSVAAACGLKFHFGLNVADLGRAVDFYRVLFGVEPAKHFGDYAKFEVSDPPLVLSLNPSPRAAGGALNHVGFRVANSAALVQVQHRLETAGIKTQREEGVECCYARQTKFWVPDADHNLWEVYTLEEDLDHSGFGGDGKGMPPQPRAPAEPAVWEHMLMAPLPDRIPFDDGRLDEIRLEGTFNLDLPAERRKALLAEALRALRPGGQISLHGLVASKPLEGRPSLPGPAALVERVPCECDPQDELAEAGFTGIVFERLGDIHCFQAGGVEFRELRLAGFKPLAQAGEPCFAVMFRGPLARVVDERGRVFPRGERVAVDEATWQHFRQPCYAGQFTCFARANAAASG